ncbi:MAG: SagB family peptide dehydrogenase [Anaerolineales bacterium]
MMGSEEIFGALAFHHGTKHPDGNLLDRRHRYNPRRRPPRVKNYKGGRVVQLPKPDSYSRSSALATLKREPDDSIHLEMDLAALGNLLHYSAGVTKWLSRPPVGKVPFRAASCTGALYHIELYAAWSGSEQLEAGLYYYQPEEHSLRQLRTGDPRERLNQAAEIESVSEAPLTLIVTSAYWRNAVKYQARAYRHAFWDSGTILANTLALSAAYGWKTQLIGGFIDSKIEGLLGIEKQTEIPLFMLAVGDGARGSAGTGLGELQAEPEPISDFDMDWPAIAAIHRETALGALDQLLDWRGRIYQAPADDKGNQKTVGLDTSEPEAVPTDPIEDVIQRRGSSRRFRRESVSSAELEAILGTLEPPVESEVGEGILNKLFIIVNGVQGLNPGKYLFHNGDLVQFDRGEYRVQSRQLALGQDLGGDAALNLYWLADLEGVVGSLGDRGYRLAQLQAAEAAGRGYLAAYGLGLGATGLTFFDDQVIEFFEPASRGMEVMFLLAIGQPS